jgi:threonine 3-dehydrogenase
MAHVCQEVSAIGFDRPGGFAQYTVLPAANAIVLPKEVHPDVGACLEPFGNAVYTSRRVDLVNKVVWVIGCGPQGLMSIAVAKAAGARKVIATETRKERFELAKQMSKTHSDPREKYEDLILNPAEDPAFLQKIYQATDGLGVDVIIEMSGYPKAIEEGLLALKKRGVIVALGLSAKPRFDIDWNNGIVLKEATVVGIYGRLLYETWTEVNYLLTSGKVTMQPIMYPKSFALKDYKEAFDLVLQGKAAKVIFKPNDLS